MTCEQVAVVVVEMETGALAVTPYLAALALTLLGPTAVAHHLKAVLPHIPEVVAVDIALVHVAAHRGAAADAAVTADAGHIDATTAIEEMVADLLLVFSKEALAGITDVDARIVLTALLNKVENAAELLVGELQVGVVGGTSHGEYAK